ncbi:hypothetical protein CCACVL1_02111 [Corchorus capsularis]|uniref:Uncharacterized protein n=1 Tax=Corchorus capsularis TaxID=210143 RepID=A0A1R3KCS5_COCAP|nr:hypothetical protein CCACVL1_02111 [Corchorus capsularis]
MAKQDFSKVRNFKTVTVSSGDINFRKS